VALPRLGRIVARPRDLGAQGSLAVLGCWDRAQGDLGEGPGLVPAMGFELGLQVQGLCCSSWAAYETLVDLEMEAVGPRWI
jgi:hypothetical protein